MWSILRSKADVEKGLNKAYEGTEMFFSSPCFALKGKNNVQICGIESM